MNDESAAAGLDWTDWSEWLVAEHRLRGTTADAMLRAVKHMTRHGVDWRRFALGPDEARSAVRPFLAAKERTGHRHAVKLYKKALNLVAPYLAVRDARFKDVRWKPDRVPTGRLDPYTLREIGALQAYRTGDRFTEARRRALLWLAEHTGLRRAELARLQVRDVDADRCAVLVREPAKEGEPRWVPVHADAFSPRRPLQAWLAVHPRSTPALWCTRTGVPLTVHGVSREFWDIRTETGVALNFNRFRHTRATDLLQRGVRLDTIQALYGHASPRSTQHYARRTLSGIEAEFLRLGVPGFVRRRGGLARVVAPEPRHCADDQHGQAEMPRRQLPTPIQVIHPIAEEAHTG